MPESVCQPGVCVILATRCCCCHSAVFVFAFAFALLPHCRLALLCCSAWLPCRYRVFHFRLKIIKSNKAVNRTFQFEFSRLRRKLYTCAALSLAHFGRVLSASVSLARCKIPGGAAESYLKRFSCHNIAQCLKRHRYKQFYNCLPLAAKCHPLAPKNNRKLNTKLCSPLFTSK